MAEFGYYQAGGRASGPWSSEQLKQFVADGKITASTLIRRGKDGDWIKAERIKALFPKPIVIEERAEDEFDGIEVDEFDGIEIEEDGPTINEFNEDDILSTLSEPKQAKPKPSDRVPCRYCGEAILATARKCKHCGEFLDEPPDDSVISSAPASNNFNSGRAVDVVRCPKCRSTQIHAEKRGWSLWTGLIGSGAVVITCLQCGNKFKPGKA